MKIVTFRVPEATFACMRELRVNWSALLREAVETELAKQQRRRALVALTRPVGNAPAPRGTAAAALRQRRGRK